MSCNSYNKHAQVMMARQRARDIATKGSSNITLYNEGSKKKTGSNKSLKDDATTNSISSSSLNTRRSDIVKDKAHEKVDAAIHQQKKELKKIEDRILREACLAKARNEGNHSSIGAVVAMKSVKKIQPEYLHRQQIIKGLEALKETIDNDACDCPQIWKDIKEITSLPNKIKCNKTFTNEELMEELEREDFLPKLH